MPRRSLSEPEETPPPPARQYLFIDSTADRARANEAVRVHVMRHSHRTRRGQSDQLQRTRTHGEMTILPPEIPLSRSETALHVPASSNRSNQPRRLSATPPTQRRPFSTDWAQSLKDGLVGVPYRSLADLENLADAYLDNVRLLQLDVLQICRGDDLALNAFLALAAYQHSPDMQESINVASAQFEAGALEKLRVRIASAPTQSHNDATLLSVLLLSRVEDLKGSSASAVHHRNALRTFVRDRGGLRALGVENPDLYRILEEHGLNE